MGLRSLERRFVVERAYRLLSEEVERFLLQWEEGRTRSHVDLRSAIIYRGVDPPGLHDRSLSDYLDQCAEEGTVPERQELLEMILRIGRWGWPGRRRGRRR